MFRLQGENNRSGACALDEGMRRESYYEATDRSSGRFAPDDPGDSSATALRAGSE